MVEGKAPGYGSSRRVKQEAEEQDRFVGKLLSDRYRIKRKIGEGGMGTVYEAVHEAIEKRIALKVLHAQYSASPEVVSRFKQEAISASRIKHQNVIDVFDFGQLGDGSCFIAMEYLEGMDLGAALEKRRHFSPEEAIRLTVQIARALGLGHGRGVVHRDLKPENVFLQTTPEGDEIVKIVDFGIAQLKKQDEADEHEVRPRRLTKTGMIFGTPEYMAPEQARGATIDQRSDIYATGVILYELLTGAVPFLGESFLEVLNQHIQSKVPPLKEANADVSVSPELERAVMKALEKDPDDRHPTMKDFSTALLRTPEGRSVRARISSFTGLEEDPKSSARIENSSYPKPVAGGGTAMFGSSSEAADLHAEAPVELPTTSSKSKIFVLVGLAAVAIAASALFFAGTKRDAAADPEFHETAPHDRAPNTAPPEAKDSDPPALDAAKPASAPDEAAVTQKPEAISRVKLQINTDPEGGVVKKDGFQVCSRAPCEVMAEVGEAVTFTAEKGAARGEAKVLAQADQEVLIQLLAPRVAPRPRPQPQPAEKALCEVMVDGIKILRPCQ